MKEELRAASEVFAPDFPRHSSSVNTFQAKRDNREEFFDALYTAAEAPEMPGFYSVYAFPRGHPKQENIPKVDCIFIDLDLTGEQYDPDQGDDSYEAWRRDMSALLARTRMLASALIEEGVGEHFRVALSGHKGLHLYLDFPAIAPGNGSFQQFKAGLNDYGGQVMEWLDAEAGGVDIEPWVDVDASDLARLARHPNTPHDGAAYTDDRKWCVPVMVEELVDLDVDRYEQLTDEPRWPDGYERTPSPSAGRKASQYVREADVGSVSVSTGRSTYDPEAVQEYQQNSNDDIELEDVLLLVSNKPCIEAFRERDDAYEHGEASREMELNIIARLAEMGVPMNVMHEFFEPIPRYDEEFTQELIEDVIGRGYKEWNCENIVGTTSGGGSAEEFCLGGDCGVYRRASELQK